MVTGARADLAAQSTGSGSDALSPERRLQAAKSLQRGLAPRGIRPRVLITGLAIQATYLCDSGDGQADHIEIVAVDPGHQDAAATLDRVAPGPALPLPRGQVPVDRGVVELAERHVGDL